jgi:phage terminase Nu1 subunit (DNA packaging protein)
VIGNQSDCARVLGLTRGRVSQLVRTKVLTLRKDGKIDLDEAQREYMAYLGEGRPSNPGQSSMQLNELVTLKLENARAKLEIQQAAVELQKLKASIAKGELVNWQAARLLLSRVLWNLRNQVWGIPLKIIHRMAADHRQQVELDQAIQNSFETAFVLTNEHDIAAENAYVLAMSDALIRLCETEIVIMEHEHRDTDTLKSCMDFARKIKTMFFEMKPELVEKLGMKLHTRGSREAK